jgi:MFS family permease
MSTSKPPFFYGWMIAIFASAMMAVSNGLGLAALTVFDPDLLAEFDIGRGELKIRDSITLGIAALAGPFIGALLDKYGVRPFALIAFALLSASLFAYSTAENLQTLYWIHGVIGLVWTCGGLIAGVSLVSRWFVTKRGLAIGITVAGSSAGNMIFPQYSAWLISDMGLDWQTASLWLMIIPLIMMPLAWLIIRERPEDKGLVMLGAENFSKQDHQQTTGLTYKEAIKTANFWLLAIMAMLTFYPILSYISHLILHMTDQGLPLQEAATGLSTLFALGMISKLLSGHLAEKFGLKRTLITCITLMLLGSIIFIDGEGSMLWLAIVVTGFGWGGLYVMLQYITAEIFGTRAIGAIIGTITFLDAMGGAMGPTVTGILFDQNGNYQLPFTLISIFIFIALICASFIKMPKHHAR